MWSYMARQVVESDAVVLGAASSLTPALTTIITTVAVLVTTHVNKTPILSNGMTLTSFTIPLSRMNDLC